METFLRIRNRNPFLRFWIGVPFLLALDHLISHLQLMNVALIFKLTFEKYSDMQAAEIAKKVFYCNAALMLAEWRCTLLCEYIQMIGGKGNADRGKNSVHPVVLLCWMAWTHRQHAFGKGGYDDAGQLRYAGGNYNSTRDLVIGLLNGKAGQFYLTINKRCASINIMYGIKNGIGVRFIY